MSTKPSYAEQMTCKYDAYETHLKLQLHDILCIHSGPGARHRSVYRLDVRPEHTTRSKRPSHNNIITTKKKVNLEY